MRAAHDAYALVRFVAFMMQKTIGLMCKRTGQGNAPCRIVQRIERSGNCQCCSHYGKGKRSGVPDGIASERTDKPSIAEMVF